MSVGQVDREARRYNMPARSAGSADLAKFAASDRSGAFVTASVFLPAQRRFAASPAMLVTRAGERRVGAESITRSALGVVPS